MGNHPLNTKDWLGVPRALRWLGGIMDALVMLKGSYDSQNDMVRVHVLTSNDQESWILIRRDCIMSAWPCSDGNYKMETKLGDTYTIDEQEFERQFNIKRNWERND